MAGNNHEETIVWHNAAAYFLMVIDLMVARETMIALEMERGNGNCVGGVFTERDFMP